MNGNVCRLCLSSDRNLSSIFESEVNHESIASKLNMCLEYEVKDDDPWSKLICDHCLKLLNDGYTFLQKCKHTDSKLFGIMQEQQNASSSLLLNLCRLCGEYGKNETDILNTEKPDLIARIQQCVKLPFSDSDPLPKSVCDACSASLDSLYDFRQQVNGNFSSLENLPLKTETSETQAPSVTKGEAVSIKNDIPVDNCVSSDQQNLETTESVDELGLLLLQALLSMNPESSEVEDDADDQQLTHDPIEQLTNENNITVEARQVDFNELEDTKTSSLRVIDRSDNSSNIENPNRDISCSVKEGSSGSSGNKSNETLHHIGEKIIGNTVDSSSSLLNKSETDDCAKETNQCKAFNIEDNSLSSSVKNQETDSRNDAKLSERECKDSLRLGNDCLDNVSTSDRSDPGNSECDKNDRHEGANSDQTEARDSGNVVSGEERVSLANCGENLSRREGCGCRKRRLSLPGGSDETSKRNSYDSVAQEVNNKVISSTSVSIQASRDQNLGQVLASNVSELRISICIKAEMDDEQVESNNKESVGKANTEETTTAAVNESEHELGATLAKKIALELSGQLRASKEASYQNIEALEDKTTSKANNEDLNNSSMPSSLNQQTENIEENLDIEEEKISEGNQIDEDENNTSMPSSLNQQAENIDIEENKILEGSQSDEDVDNSSMRSPLNQPEENLDIEEEKISEGNQNDEDPNNTSMPSSLNQSPENIEENLDIKRQKKTQEDMKRRYQILISKEDKGNQNNSSLFSSLKQPSENIEENRDIEEEKISEGNQRDEDLINTSMASPVNQPEENIEENEEYVCKKALLKAEKSYRAIKCIECNEELIARGIFDVWKHMWGKHKIGRFICPECGKYCFSKADFKNHMSRHGEKQILCSLCKKWYFNIRDLTKHYKFVHMKCSPPPVVKSTEPGFTCEVCQRSFETKGKLRSHIRNHDKTQVPCKKCGKMYSIKCINVHERRCFGKLYQCEVCGSQLSNRQIFKLHMKMHTGDQETFVCEICGRKFARKNNLITHLNLHAGIRKLSCATCGRKFAQMWNLRSHVKSCLLQPERTT